MNRKLALPLLAALIAGPVKSLDQPSQRSLVLKAMSNRPTDPWPRGEGHVLLGVPGTSEHAKAYHEPGGSFSPAVGTFGISFWIVDSSGTIVATSDKIPLDQVKQRYLWSNASKIPGIETVTPFYRAFWSRLSDGTWQLALSPKLQTGNHLAILVRSVGPAGGPINRLQWSGNKLQIDEHWSIIASKPLAITALGHEGDDGWLKARNNDRQWRGADGWGYARFSTSGAVQLQLRGPSAAQTELPFTGTKSALDIDLPDPQFQESLNDQVANLMMSLVRNETRPGEPVNYPLAWLRDGAYTLTALARSGRVDTAQSVALYFAEHDFFGGFGPEADAPGLSLWALEEVALRVRDHGFDTSLWPHVQRKAELIGEMLNAKAPVFREPYGPIVPRHLKEKDLKLVCEASRDGLIIGRMDWHRPILFINAVSYRGLLSAAGLAARLGQKKRAAEWQAQASQLRKAWLVAFTKPEWENDRTYISALWQTWILDSDTQEFEKRLSARWMKGHDSSGNYREKPLWTYFNVAEAHQWLLLDHPDKTWNTVNWFWSHQASPGLYTWWEGKGEENSFHGWDEVRGWVHPAHVTPHYWTAAEMLLLQMDMLVNLDQRAEPAIVIGRGIKPEWLGSAMHVSGLAAGDATVDWAWDRKRMTVTVHRSHLPVRLSPVFSGAKPKVTYEDR